MAWKQVPTMGGSVAGASIQMFLDSGSAAVIPRGLVIIEVDDGSEVCGGAIAVGGSSWVTLLTSSSRGSAPNPTFTESGSSIVVATAGGTGKTITVTARRLCAQSNVSATR